MTAPPGPHPEAVWDATMPAHERVGAPPLDGNTAADVTIVGAGLGGLWTAYYLAGVDPALRIVVVDASTIGFGASGRNGGWCSGLLPMSLTTLAAAHGRYAAVAMHRAMHASVDEVARVLNVEAIDADFVKGGTLSLSRTGGQARRLRSELDEARSFGLGEDDLRWLEPGDVAGRCGATDVGGALFSPHCAAVHPLKLVHGVAAAARRRGVHLHEHTRVEEVRPGCVETIRGTVRTEVVVLATEAYTARLPRRRRELLPLYSLMVATDPLTEAEWSVIGLHDRATFTDGRHAIVYGQRTADGRLAFGGRGAPYHFGSRIEDRFDTSRRVQRRLVEAARELFPVLGDVEFPYHWGGPLGVSRDWHSSVNFDRSSRMAAAGGYVGDGVAATNLAGRTLAALITGHEDPATELAWVGYRSRPWEHEPLRWLGVNVGRVAASRADHAERSGGPLASTRAALWSRVVTALTGE